jgi:CAAX protease family protein
MEQDKKTLILPTGPMADQPADSAHPTHSDGWAPSTQAVVPPYPAPGSPTPPTTGPGASLAFHRLAHVSGRYRWWRPLVGAVVVLVATLLAQGVVYGGSDVAGSLAHRPQDSDGFTKWGAIPDTALDLLVLALLIPAVLLAVRWAGRRPAGTVSSVAGRLRWRWLAICLAVAFPVAAVTLGTSVLASGGVLGPKDEWADPSSFLLGLAMTCVFVPFQAAGEEYAFRGWLLQAAGAWCRWPWVAVVPQSLLFAAAHGLGTPWGFADLTVFGLVAGFLTIRTGGLEAGIGLHVLNNVLGLGLASAIAGGLTSEETAADLDPLTAAVDASLVLLYAVVVLWLARRRRLGAVRVPSAAGA